MFKDETENNIKSNVYALVWLKLIKYLDINPMMLIKSYQNFSAIVYKFHIVHKFIL